MSLDQQGASSMSLDQTIYDKVAAHLLAQGRLSQTIDGWDAYRGEGGLRCAIGCLIDDAHYRADTEGRSVRHKDVVRAVKSSLGLRYLATSTLDLLDDLQTLHDLTPPEKWHHGLKKLAHKYDLELTVCEPST